MFTRLSSRVQIKGIGFNVKGRGELGYSLLVLWPEATVPGVGSHYVDAVARRCQQPMLLRHLQVHQLSVKVV